MTESIFDKERKKLKKKAAEDRKSGLTGGPNDKRDATTRDYGYVGMGGSNSQNEAAARAAKMNKKKRES